MRLEVDSYDRSYILYNIGLTHTSNGKHARALEYYFQAPERNSFLPQASNNMAVICHHVRLPTLQDSPVYKYLTNETGFPQAYFQTGAVSSCGIQPLSKQSGFERGR